MPWTKRPDVTIADALAFEEMLDEIAEQDRTARLRDAYMPRYHDLAFDRLPMTDALPREAHHD